MISNHEIKQEKMEQKLTEKGHPVSGTIKPKINLNICKKNYNCVVFCPRNAISINQKGSPVINYDLCDSCLICLRECPTSAILEEVSEK